MDREETKFKRARQLWVCAKGKEECLGLQGVTVVPLRTEVEEIRKGKHEAMGTILIWGDPRETHESVGYVYTGLCQRSQGSWVCMLGEDLGHPILAKYYRISSTRDETRDILANSKIEPKPGVFAYCQPFCPYLVAKE
uniref:Uncharacterized protein n=1 Tax=Rousettus aegyptiacus TaxID=9407 RepID=A0A7J8EJV1_ROUAE|nr:hypothetical protein HJG63_012480 [Rousettus aegyptiacus]